MNGAESVRRQLVGLCARCRHHRVIGTRKGSRFWLCERAKTDPRFRRYPPLPVLRCPGFDAESEELDPSTGSDSGGSLRGL